MKSITLKIVFFLVLIVLLLPSAYRAAAQANREKVSGRVTDTKGAPLPGVSVAVSGTGRGVTTDAEGRYTLTGVPASATLVFTFVGMQRQEVALSGRTTLNVTLAPADEQLDELVVVGYGVKRKVNLVGSVSQLDARKLEGRPVPLLSNALAGQMAGVTFINRSGAPGSAGTIRVRGVGSFGAAPDALVLIDGIPGGINDVRPDEVEAISVLKDASSAAIYGARAANGVILITTKTGRTDRVRVAYTLYGGFTDPAAFPEMLSSWEYAQAYNEAAGTTTYSAEDIARYRSGEDRARYPNSSMLNEVFTRRGFQTGHDLTVTGGTAANRYYLAVGYLSQQGLIEKNDLSRYSARLNMESRLTPRLKLLTRLSGITSAINEPASVGGKDVLRMSGIVSNAVRYPAVYATVLPNGDYGTGPEQTGTPPAWVRSASFFRNLDWKFRTNLELVYEPVKNLKLSAIGGYNLTLSDDKTFNSTLRLNERLTVGPSLLSQSVQRGEYRTLQATARYSGTRGGHQLSALGGYSLEMQQGRGISGSRDKLPGNDLPYLSAGSPDNQKVSGGGSGWAIQSLFGRLEYSYRGRYLFESTVRYDGSSRFPPSRKYGLFPSFAAGWRLSEEPLVRRALPWLSNLKLKGSWGMLGNQNIGDYPWQPVYGLGEGYPFGGSMVQGAALTTLVDPNLHWEATQTADAGFESSLLGNRLTLEASYFYRRTTDILYSPGSSVSRVLGKGLSAMNTGSLLNSGVEVELGFKSAHGDFSYFVSGNFTYTRNRVLDLGVGNVLQPNGLMGNGSSLFVGYPMQLYYGLVTDGVFLDQADIDAWYLKNDQSSINPKASARPGDLRYVDLNGDGKVEVGRDSKVLGSQIPKYTFMLSFGFSYKGFDFSTLLQGVAGVQGNLGRYAGMAFYNLGNIQRWMWDGRFDPQRPVRYPQYPRLQVLGNSVGVNGVMSDFWVLDASYLRVKNLQVGYSLPDRVAGMLRLEGLRVYASGENLLTLSRYRRGWDPEINSSGDFYPILTTYTLGLNIKF